MPVIARIRRKKSDIEEFDAKRVRPLPGQPRKRFRQIPELAESIAETGQIDPGIVTLVDDDEEFDAQLVDGERRLRACLLVPCDFTAQVISPEDAEAIFVKSFAANFGKQNHDAIEIAEGLERMRLAGKSAEQMKRIAGKSLQWVYGHLNLLKLHVEVRGMMVSEGEEESAPLSFALAQLLVPLAEKKQLSLARRIVKQDMSQAAARRMVLAVRAKEGDEHAYVPRGAGAKTVDAMESMITRMTDQVGVYLDMPGKVFNAMLDAVDNTTKKTLVKIIEEASDGMIDLASSIEDRMKATAAARKPN